MTPEQMKMMKEKQAMPMKELKGGQVEKCWGVAWALHQSGLDPKLHIDEFALAHVREIHLAAPDADEAGGRLLIDSHDRVQLSAQEPL